MSTGVIQYNALAEILANLDVSKPTRDDYAIRLPVFVDFVQANGLDVNTYRAYKRYLGDRGDWAVATKDKYLTVARVILRELHRLGHMPVDVTVNTKGFQVNNGHKKFGFTTAEVKSFGLRLSSLPRTPINIRLTAFFWLLVAQGLRQIEIVRLDVQDINFAQGVMMIHGKGRDDKEPVKMYPQTAKAIRIHMEQNRAKDGALFRSLGNRGSARLSTRMLRNDIRRLIGLTPKSAHGFRHHFVTVLLAAGMSPLEVMKMSRHHSVQTLTAYNDDIQTDNAAKKAHQIIDQMEI